MGAPTGNRIGGIELARSLALTGMLAAHMGPPYDGGLAWRLYALPYGRASILFVLLAGIGVSLLAASRSQSWAETRLKLTWRAMLLLPLGVALQQLSDSINVILPAYALLFLVAMIAIRLSDRWLLLLAAAAVTCGPLVYLASQMLAGQAFGPELLSFSQPLTHGLHSLLVSGPYPLITWAAPFLLGIWLGRRDLSAPSLRIALILIGAALAASAWLLARQLGVLFGEPDSAVSWTQLIVKAPHSQMPLWLANGIGAAMLALGLALFAADRFSRLLRPLIVAGQMTLTIYVAQLLALYAWPELFSPDDVSGAVTIVLGFMAAAVIGALAWRALLPRGPLETVVHAPWALHGRLRPNRAPVTKSL